MSEWVLRPSSLCLEYVLPIFGFVLLSTHIHILQKQPISSKMKLDRHTHWVSLPEIPKPSKTIFSCYMYLYTLFLLWLWECEFLLKTTINVRRCQRAIVLPNLQTRGLLTFFWSVKIPYSSLHRYTLRSTTISSGHIMWRTTI